MARHVRKGWKFPGKIVQPTHMQDEGFDPILLLFLVLVGALVAALGMAAYLVFLS